MLGAFTPKKKFKTHYLYDMQVVRTWSQKSRLNSHTDRETEVHLPSCFHFKGMSPRPLHKHAKSLQSCPTLCNPMDHSLPGFSVHGILQARILEWAAMPSSQGIFPTQELNPHLLCLLHWQAGCLPLVPPMPLRKTLMLCKIGRGLFSFEKIYKHLKGTGERI